MDQSLLPVLVASLLGAIAALACGLGLAERLVRSKGSRTDLQVACRLHEWMRLEDGRFVCLQCSYQAGSSRQFADLPRGS